MNAAAQSPTTRAASIVFGRPLSEEPGLGTLTLPGYLREITGRYAAREALVMRTAAGVERWTYTQLWERSREAARALVAAGVGKDNRVGVFMTNRLEFLSAVFGTALAGGVAVPLSTFSTPVELEYLLQASAVSTLCFESSVLSKDYLATLTALEPGIRTAQPGRLMSVKFPHLRRLVMVGAGAGGGAVETWQDFLRAGAAVPGALVEAIAASVRPSDNGMIFFSSGTTSKPKGILSAQRAVAIQLWRWPRIYDHIHGDIRCWAANGFFWSGVFGMALGCTFSYGGALVLQQTFSPAEALALMEQERVNLPLGWPHQWSRLEEAPNWQQVDLGSVRFVDRRNALARHPTIHTDWEEPRAYGVTETFTINVAYPASTPADVVGGSYGEVLPGNTLKIVDPLTGAIVPRGQRGEIAVKGPTLMRGYLGIPLDETLDAEGFYHTGDGGYLNEAGWLHWEGRLTEVIKTGGANVSPVEVDVVLNTCPGIKVGQTVGVPHETLGELVVACVVPHDGVTVSEASVKDFLKERLASYKVPRRVLFFREDELILTGSAKVKAGALRELAAKRLAGT
jgi:fatty-acyl-CoA synthase